MFAATAERRRGGARSSSHARGIARAALQAHVDGVVVKFYGVADGRFFRCYTERAEIPRPSRALGRGARRRVGARPRGVRRRPRRRPTRAKPVLVDLNDWPSFARCRDEAADAIAGYVVDRLAATWPRTPRTAWIRNPAPNPAPSSATEQAVVAPGQQRIALLSELALASGRGRDGHRSRRQLLPRFLRRRRGREPRSRAPALHRESRGAAPPHLGRQLHHREPD
mgnify:CR=1 FL=1